MKNCNCGAPVNEDEAVGDICSKTGRFPHACVGENDSPAEKKCKAEIREIEGHLDVEIERLNDEYQEWVV